MRSICGWERVHEAFIKKHYSSELVGHNLRDSTSINAREKPVKKRGRPKKGEVCEKELMRIEKQAEGMELPDILQDLPKTCDVGAKKNSKGYKISWIGYKLHIDSVDGGIPISCILTSASTHDSQVAIPLAKISSERVSNLYDLMDSAYDVPQIHEISMELGHIPLIDKHPRMDIALFLSFRFFSL